MAIGTVLLFLLHFGFPVDAGTGHLTLSSKLIHRFSDEARVLGNGRWPSKGSMEYYSALVGGDVIRRGAKSGRLYQVLYPSEGSEALALGNDFGWLHYTWIDVGTPNVSFLVALDVGSDLTWLPCDCIQCAPLSSQYNSLDQDLNMYSPAKSSTSKNLSCSHELCISQKLGQHCESANQSCSYELMYQSVNTSTSGMLVEDTLYLLSSNTGVLIQARVVIGCGTKQTGGYLDGIAPDGLLALGLGDISIPTFLAREGLVHNSFSLCFTNDGSGKILFGDQGTPMQKSTPFIPIDGKYLTYMVQVDGFCIGTKCLDGSMMRAIVDSGSSFTYLPYNVYKLVTLEFVHLINQSRATYEGSPWEYCYNASLLQIEEIPQVTLTFSVNKSFVVINPIFRFHYEGHDGFCLALQQSDDDVGTIGQNLMTGYRIVFDREILKLGWSRSDCNDLDTSRTIPLTAPLRDKPENPLPTEQESSSRAVSPAEAGKAPMNLSSCPQLVLRFDSLLLLLFYAFSVIFGG